MRFFFVVALCAASTVQTQYGLVSGTLSNGFVEYLGIPYAAPPVGDLRWTAPQAPSSWSGVYAATEFGPCCAQSNFSYPNPSLPISEDCLYLNVYAPLSEGPHPVMVYIHGGAFISGCSASLTYRGGYFSNSSETVIVTLNYRLGAFGFLCDSIANINGNFGFLDQIAALQWVKSNIDAFGGDSNRITLFGQSAGAMSTTLHLVSPTSYELGTFQQAIIESNPVAVRYRTVDEMQQHADTFAKWADCSPYDAACLRALSMETVIELQSKTIEIPWKPSLALTELPWEPTCDGVLIPDQPLALFEQGNFYHVPIIIGNVRNESNVFGYMLQSALNINELSALEYESLVLLFFQQHTSAILHAYPAMSDSFNALFRLTSDYIFLCPSRLLAMFAARVVPVRWYQYLLSTKDDPITPYEHLCFVNQTVCHAAEVSYVFHSVENYPGFHFSPSESEFSLSLLRVWASFANSSLSEQFWPLFDNTTLLSMQFDLQSSIASGYHASNCDLWDEIGYDW